MISLRASRLPLLNQRHEYEHYRRIIRDPKFRSQFTTKGIREFECGKFLWSGLEEGATVLLQRIALGLEARIPVAVMLELSCRGKLTREIAGDLEDPFALKGKWTADCYYNRAPALIEPQFALRRADPELWDLVSTFYRDIRNPIFHGSYITDLSLEKFDYVFSVFDRVYSWCDTWCDFIKRMNEVMKGVHGRPKAKTA
jgi:hypothetical protein